MKLLGQLYDKHYRMKLLQLSYLSSPLLTVLLFAPYSGTSLLLEQHDFVISIEAGVRGHCGTEFDIRPLFGNASFFYVSGEEFPIIFLSWAPIPSQRAASVGFTT
jgi:hypothetical protein